MNSASVVGRNDSIKVKTKENSRTYGKQKSSSFVIKADDMWQVIFHSVAPARRRRTTNYQENNPK